MALRLPSCSEGQFTALGSSQYGRVRKPQERTRQKSKPKTQGGRLSAPSAAHAGGLKHWSVAGRNQRPPTLEGCEERSASLILRLSTVGFNTSPTPGIARALSNRSFITALAGATRPETDSR